MIIRHIEFTGPDGSVTRIPLLEMLKAVFARLAPDRPLPSAPKLLYGGFSNYGSDDAYYTAEGDGILVGEQHLGALPGETFDVMYRLTLGTEVDMFVSIAADHAQETAVFRLRATPEMIDAATDALIEAAGADGLVFVRRIDDPKS